MSNKSEGQNKQTTVEEGTQFKGTLTSTCQVMVRGVVDGDLSAPVVIVSESGTVTGNVKALYAEYAAVPGITISRPLCVQEYGMEEFDVIDLNGHRLVFAQPIAEA